MNMCVLAFLCNRIKKCLIFLRKVNPLLLIKNFPCGEIFFLIKAKTIIPHLAVPIPAMFKHKSSPFLAPGSRSDTAVLAAHSQIGLVGRTYPELLLVLPGIWLLLCPQRPGYVAGALTRSTPLHHPGGSSSSVANHSLQWYTLSSCFAVGLYL